MLDNWFDVEHEQKVVNAAFDKNIDDIEDCFTYNFWGGWWSRARTRWKVAEDEKLT